MRYNENEFYLMERTINETTKICYPREDFEVLPFKSIDGHEMAVATNCKFPYIRIHIGACSHGIGWTIGCSSTYATNKTERDKNFPIVSRGVSSWLLARTHYSIDPFTNKEIYTLDVKDDISEDYIKYLYDGDEPTSEGIEYIKKQEKDMWEKSLSNLIKYIPESLFIEILKHISKFLGIVNVDSNTFLALRPCFIDNDSCRAFINKVHMKNGHPVPNNVKTHWDEWMRQKVSCSGADFCRVLTDVYGFEYNHRNTRI